jgi:hypothetical protein
MLAPRWRAVRAGKTKQATSYLRGKTIADRVRDGVQSIKILKRLAMTITRCGIKDTPIKDGPLKK